LKSAEGRNPITHDIYIESPPYKNPQIQKS